MALGSTNLSLEPSTSDVEATAVLLPLRYGLTSEDRGVCTGSSEGLSRSTAVGVSIRKLSYMGGPSPQRTAALLGLGQWMVRKQAEH